MAGPGGDMLPANCGVQPSDKSILLSYKVGKNAVEKQIVWQWESSGNMFVAKFEARLKSGDVRYHRSAPIDADTYSKLGKPDKTLDGEYYKVKLKKTPDTPDLNQFFNVPQ